MATYEYKCKGCGQEITVTRSISDKENVPECLACNLLLSRVYSPIGVAFNGSGFYRTDNASR